MAAASSALPTVVASKHILAHAFLWCTARRRVAWPSSGHSRRASRVKEAFFLTVFYLALRTCSGTPVDGGTSVDGAGGGTCNDTPPSMYLSVANRTCLITGISGMIGSYIAREVASRGCSVHGIVRYRTHWGNLAGMLDGSIVFHKGDITDAAFVWRTVESVQPDFIFHLAAQSLNGISTSAPFLTMQVNVEGTLNVLEAVKGLSPAKRPRVFNAGSSTVYGKTANEWEGPIPEHAPLQPVTPYGVSKVTQEMLAQQYFFAHGIHVVTGRFFQQVATGGPETLAIQDFAMQVAMIELGVRPKAEVFHGNLETLRDMTDVRDSARVMVDLAEKSAPGLVYNVCSSRAIKVRDLLSTLLSISPIGSTIALRQDPARFRDFDEKVLLGDNRKLVAATGWQPTTAFNDTVASVLQYWRREVKVRFELI